MILHEKKIISIRLEFESKFTKIETIVTIQTRRLWTHMLFGHILYAYCRSNNGFNSVWAKCCRWCYVLSQRFIDARQPMFTSQKRTRVERKREWDRARNERNRNLLMRVTKAQSKERTKPKYREEKNGSLRCVIRTVRGEWIVCVRACVTASSNWTSIPLIFIASLHLLDGGEYVLHSMESVWLDLVWFSPYLFCSVHSYRNTPWMNWRRVLLHHLMCFSHYFPHFVCLLIQCNAMQCNTFTIGVFFVSL